jgi:hypothetical protein
MDSRHDHAVQSRFVLNETQQLVESPLRLLDIATDFTLGFADRLKVLYRNDAVMFYPNYAQNPA